MSVRVLMVHNRYQQAGGEDQVFEAESGWLEKNGYPIERLVFTNDAIQGPIAQALAGLKGLYNSDAAKQLMKAIKAHQPSVIHIHNWFPVASPSILLIAQQQQIPVVMTLHNYRLICANAQLYVYGSHCTRCVNKVLPWDGIQRGCYRGSRLQTAATTVITTSHHLMGTWRNRVSRYIALTQFARDRLLNSRLGLEPEQIVVKPNWLDDPGPSTAHLEPESEASYLFVGRLSPEKGIDTLLDAFKASQKPLDIIGSGPMTDYVRHMADHYDNIKYLGPQPREQVLRSMRQAKALIFPSQWYEGFPMVLVEAMAMGLPAIASRLGSMTNIVQHGKTGLLFPTSNSDALNESVGILDNNPQLLEAMRHNAREAYLANYTADVVMPQLVALYEEVIDTFSQGVGAHRHGA